MIDDAFSLTTSGSTYHATFDPRPRQEPWAQVVQEIKERKGEAEMLGPTVCQKLEVNESAIQPTIFPASSNSLASAHRREKVHGSKNHV